MHDAYLEDGVSTIWRAFLCLDQNTGFLLYFDKIESNVSIFANDLGPKFGHKPRMLFLNDWNQNLRANFAR